MVGKTVYLHIGAPKTGTSALQSALVRNRPWLQQRGFAYPASDSDAQAEAGRITSGNGFALAKYMNPKSDVMPNANIAAIWAHTRREIDAAPGNVLYSSEFFFFMDPERLQLFAEDLRSMGVGLKIILWLRNITEHALSAYNQVVKRHKQVNDFETFCRTEYRANFLAVLRHCHTAVAREDVIVGSYDDNRTALFASFCRDLGIDATGVTEIAETINRSLSRYELEVIRYLNRIVESQPALVKLSDALLYADPDKRPAYTISQREADILEARFGDEVREINGLVGRPVIALGSPAVPVGPAAAFALDERDTVLLALLAAQLR